MRTHLFRITHTAVVDGRVGTTGNASHSQAGTDDTSADTDSQLAITLGPTNLLNSLRTRLSRVPNGSTRASTPSTLRAARSILAPTQAVQTLQTATDPTPAPRLARIVRPASPATFSVQGFPVPVGATNGLTTPTPPAVASSPIKLITHVVSTIGAVALDPFAAPGPTAPVAPNPLVELGFAVLRRTQSSLFNQSPSAHPIQNTQTLRGVVTGTVGATDADGDALTYTVTKAPAHGAVTVNSDGTYTYTADSSVAMSGGSDSFTVTTREANADSHIHGFAGLLAGALNTFSFGLIDIPDGSTISKVVPVTVDGPPFVGTRPAGVTDPTTGAVTGSLGFTDPNGDPLTYTVTSHPTSGTVTVDNATGTGTYTYTPTQAARLIAGTTTQVERDSFAITASDGTLTTATTIDPQIDAVKLYSVREVVGDRPTNLAVRPDGTLAYVVLAGDDTNTGSVLLIDGLAARNGSYNVIDLDPTTPGADGITVGSRQST